MKIALIGTGNMGFPIAENLLDAGYDLNVYNRTISKALPLGDKGAFVADNLSEVVQDRELIITILPNDDALLMFCENEAFNLMSHNVIHVSMSTISPQTAANLCKLHEDKGFRFVSAPIFGRPEAVKAKLANVCLSGDDTVKAIVEKVLLDSCATKVWNFGDKAESALVIKLAGNFLIAASIEMMAESFRLVELGGADEKMFYDLMSETLFSSIIFKNYGKIIVEKNYNKTAGFELNLGLKDLSLILQTANAINFPMPFANIVENRLHSAMRKGRSTLDWTALGMGVLDDSE